MRKRIRFTKAFEEYRRRYGTKRALSYLAGYYLIPDKYDKKFKKQAMRALKEGKKGFVFDSRKRA